MRNWSLWGDFKIILSIVGVVIPRGMTIWIFPFLDVLIAKENYMPKLVSVISLLESKDTLWIGKREKVEVRRTSVYKKKATAGSSL